MEKMLFTRQQPNVKVVELPDGKRDVTVLTNEETVDVQDYEGHVTSQAYEYDGNQFRTVYAVTEEDVSADFAKYLDYDASTEPTLAQLEREQEAIDAYTMKLIESGVIS